MSAETEFLNELNIFKNEVSASLKFLYAELSIHEIANGDKKVLKALNRTPDFWNTVLAGLQNSLFVTLGRIFDNNSRHNIKKLLKLMENHIDLFSKRAFAERWVGNSDRKKIDTWLVEYLKTLYVPTPSDIKKFILYAQKQRSIYEGIYRPIRDHFGHRLWSKNEDIKVLFDKVQVRDLEKFCVRLTFIHEAIWQLYHNGRGPLLPIKKGKYSTKNILKSKYILYTPEPINVQFVNQVKTALNLLKSQKK